MSSLAETVVWDFAIEEKILVALRNTGIWICCGYNNMQLGSSNDVSQPGFISGIEIPWVRSEQSPSRWRTHDLHARLQQLAQGRDMLVGQLYCEELHSHFDVTFRRVSEPRVLCWLIGPG